MKREVGSRTGREKESAARQTQQSFSQCDRESWSKYRPSLSQIGLKWEMSGPLLPPPSVSRYWSPGKGSDLVRQLSAAEADPKAVFEQQDL